MQCLLNSIIYLLAIMGIIFTTITFFEMFIQKKTINNSYRIFNKNNEDNNKERVEVVIHIENLDEKEEEKLVKKIVEKNEINLKEIATSISIQKDR